MIFNSSSFHLQHEVMGGSLTLREWGTTWHEWGGKGRRCWPGDQERQDTFYQLPQLPVVLGWVTPLAPTSVTCAEACSSHHFTGCTQPCPPRLMAHLPQPTRQNQNWFSFLSFLSFLPTQIFCFMAASASTTQQKGWPKSGRGQHKAG